MSVGGTSNLRIYFVDGMLTVPAGSSAAILLLLEDDDMATIQPGVVKDLVAMVREGSDATPFVGTALALIRLEQDGDAADGFHWTGAAWASGTGTVPTATHLGNGRHLYQLPVAAASGRDGARILVSFTDDTDPGAETTVCGTREYEVTDALTRILLLLAVGPVGVQCVIDGTVEPRILTLDNGVTIEFATVGGVTTATRTA